MSQKGESSQLVEKNMPRKHKRGKVLHKIKNQMEFYFSLANLKRDRFLGNLVRSNPDGYVDFVEFLKFNQIRKLTDDVDDIVKAVSDSTTLEVNSEKTKIRAANQTQQLTPDSNDDNCIIYVERLPLQSDHGYVKNIFARFGKITYISLPRFKHSNKIKGFAFIEFDNEESAKQACEAYKSMSSSEVKNKEIASNVKSKNVANDVKSKEVADSVKSREVADEDEKSKLLDSKKKSVDFSPVKNKDGTIHKSPRKRKRSENDKTPEKLPTKVSEISEDKGPAAESEEPHGPNRGSCKKHKKRKRQSSDSEGAEQKRKRLFSGDAEDEAVKDHHDAADHPIKSSGSENPSVDLKRPSDVLQESSDDEPVKKVKLEETKDMVENENADVEVKAEVDEKDAEDPSEKRKKRKRKKKGNNEKPKLRVISKADWKHYRNKYQSMQKRAMTVIKKMLLINKKQKAECEAMLSKSDELDNELPVEEEPIDPKKVPNAEIVYQPGVIAKVALKNCPDVASELVRAIKSKIDVAFVDVLEEKKAFVRFHDPESATEALKNDALLQFGHYELIKGKEESAYWEKLHKDREAQCNRQKINRRGRDKIIARVAAATKQKATHIHFDDSF